MTVNTLRLTALALYGKPSTIVNAPPPTTCAGSGNWVRVLGLGY